MIHPQEVKLNQGSDKDNSWISLSAANPLNNIGYVFPNSMNTLDVQIEERSGRYGDINEYFVNDKTYTNTFAKISKNYGKTAILKDISMQINTGEFICLVGPSGSGKTTLLKTVNRLVNPDNGQILLDNQSINQWQLRELRLQIGYVIQQISLFPHMTVYENITLIPELKKIPKAKWQEMANFWLKKVGLNPKEVLHRYPKELSGGQQQRVGIVRALITQPKILLMDEPFSALDPLSRQQLQDLLKQLHEELHLTVIFVTHDMDEALKLADRIAVLQNGELVQFASPSVIQSNPQNAFVAQVLKGREYDA